jgi:uncharacterized protein YfiM (DUF2279 family)
LLASRQVIVANGDGFPLVGRASLANQSQQQHGGIAQLVSRCVGVPGMVVRTSWAVYENWGRSRPADHSASEVNSRSKAGTGQLIPLGWQRATNFGFHFSVSSSNDCSRWETRTSGSTLRRVDNPVTPFSMTSSPLNTAHPVSLTPASNANNTVGSLEAVIKTLSWRSPSL